MTADERRVPLPANMDLAAGFGVAVLYAAQGCDHHGWQGQGGPFRMAVVSTSYVVGDGVTSARLYLSETGLWGELTSVYYLNACVRNMPSVLVGDALYFTCFGNHIVKYWPHLTCQCLRSQSWTLGDSSEQE
ncbi:hypothetical protein BRADI_2g33886v3 [Brachypodium distachyon]|uniref:Uncharacterized protein n=1 Tax=Brachypodium distachyon TaxID=15368 RepID=A0A2K2DBM8_BRADI|nr:hypothetical protein BRADI_2g33886v3 [Brachypodium distachyon]